MKRINFNLLKANYKREALKEVTLLKRLNNPHIIKYYNNVNKSFRYYNSFMESENLFIIMEFAERGDLN